MSAAILFEPTCAKRVRTPDLSSFFTNYLIHGWPGIVEGFLSSSSSMANRGIVIGFLPSTSSTVIRGTVEGLFLLLLCIFSGSMKNLVGFRILD